MAEKLMRVKPVAKVRMLKLLKILNTEDTVPNTAQ